MGWHRLVGLGLGHGWRSYVYALAVSGTNLYAGGGFTTAGGVSAKYIAKWDGSAWSALGSGMSGTLCRCAGGERDNLYAGGYFTTAGGMAANNIAKWDGSAGRPGLGENGHVLRWR